MTVSILWFFISMPCVGLQCVIVIFPEALISLIVTLFCYIEYISKLFAKLNSFSVLTPADYVCFYN